MLLTEPILFIQFLESRCSSARFVSMCKDAFTNKLNCNTIWKRDIPQLKRTHLILDVLRYSIVYIQYVAIGDIRDSHMIYSVHYSNSPYTLPVHGAISQLFWRYCYIPWCRHRIRCKSGIGIRPKGRGTSPPTRTRWTNRWHSKRNIQNQTIGPNGKNDEEFEWIYME